MARHLCLKNYEKSIEEPPYLYTNGTKIVSSNTISYIKFWFISFNSWQNLTATKKCGGKIVTLPSKPCTRNFFQWLLNIVCIMHWNFGWFLPIEALVKWLTFYHSRISVAPPKTSVACRENKRLFFCTGIVFCANFVRSKT